MCEPTTIAMASFALTAASTGAQVYGQRQQMKAQQRSNQTQYENEMTAYRANLANIEVSRNQAQADSSQKINENNQAARAAQASAGVSAGESGVAGLSVDALLRDLAGEAALDNTGVEENYLRQNAALNARRENVHSSAASSINSLQTPASPDYISAGLRIGQGGLDAYGSYQKSTKRGGR